VVIGGLALAFVATMLRPPATPAASTAACDPPMLGFGAGEGRNAPELPRTTGTLKIGMLFVDFDDSPGTLEPQSIYEAHIPRLVDWYRTASYGRLEIDVTPLARWLRLPRTLAAYEGGHFEGAVQAAVAAADPAFDFSQLQALYLVPSMAALASTVVDDVPLRVDGAVIHSWAWIATGSLARLPFVAIHETGHILGLPDLYGRLARTQHKWDVMTAAPTGGGMFAWHRWKLGWLDAGQIVCLTRNETVNVTLTPIERAGGTKAILSQVGRSVVAVEVRQRVAEDASLCRTGVLVYRVDLVAGSPENVGSRQLPIRLREARPDDSRRWNRCGPQWRAPYTAGTASSWNHRILRLTRLRDGSYRIRFVRAVRRTPADASSPRERWR
jgi:M6 family metalloprotease-like protein